MLCMSHVPVGDLDRAESVIRVFPVWPKDRDARFHNIRTLGAFLVSSELKGGNVRRIHITSERGRTCTVVNRWAGKNVTLTGRGRSEKLHGDRLTFKTRPQETLVLAPGRESMAARSTPIRTPSIPKYSSTDKRRI